MPFERLRALARWEEADEELLVEIATCLSELDDDPAAMVIACRRLLEHHRGWAALWWLCSRVLAAPRAGQAARTALDAIAHDETSTRLCNALPFPASDPVAVVGWPTVGAALLVERGDLDLLSVVVNSHDDPQLAARAHPAPVPMVSPVPQVDPPALATLAPSHLLLEPVAVGAERVLLRSGTTAVLDATTPTTRTWLLAPVGSVLPDRLLDALAVAAEPHEEVSAERFDRVVGPRGLARSDTLRGRVDAPVAPELLRPLG